MEAIDTWLEQNRERHLDELKEFLRIPSVSTDPAHKGHVREAAEWIAARMTGAGLAARLYETAGHPVVYGEWLGAHGAPTVLVYGHYDVQPPDPLDEWRHGPFEPTVEDGNLYARGATDDKGQVYCHVKAVEAHMRTGGAVPVNVKMVVEGEEEVGSANLEPFLREHTALLAADSVLISDSHMHAPGRPSITYALRGLCYIEVQVRGPAYDLHSGLYGGGVRNPVNALAQMIAALHDAKGRVTIPGFYDRVRDLTDDERAEFAALGHDEAAFRRELGVEASPGEVGYTVLERTTARPTLDCNGIVGGYTGVGAKTVLPATASAKISCRLVPDQDMRDTEERLIAHLRALAPSGVTVSAQRHHGGPPCIVDRRAPAMRAAMVALERVWGVRPVFTRGGGSIPVVASFKQLLGLDSVLMGFGLEDDRLHSPNEKFALVNYFNGIRASACTLHELARV